MLCFHCISKSVVRGVKTVKCIKCNKSSIVNYAFLNICNECSISLIICQYCGREITKTKNLGFEIVCKDCDSNDCEVRISKDVYPGYFYCNICEQEIKF